MKSALKCSLPGPVADVRRRMEEWRRTRSKRGPIPEGLWQQAALLAGRHGVHPVARALRLDYYALKRHLGEVQKAQAASQPAFVEVSLPPPHPSLDCIVELERADGGRMRLRFASDSNLVALAESFWRCQA